MQTVPWQSNTNSWFAIQTNQTPWIDHNDPYAHSLGQLWGLDNTLGPAFYSDVEVGWHVDYGLYRDYDSHLFVFSFDRGIPGCYNDRNALCPEGGRGYFHRYPGATVFPGMVVPAGEHQYGMLYQAGNWWVNYDGQWVGYYPASSYPGYHHTGMLLLEAGGEVEQHNSAACSDMGNSNFGTSGIASYFKQTWRGYDGGAQTAAGQFTPYNSDPSAWNTAYWNYNGPNGSFLYGGPGYPGCGA